VRRHGAEVLSHRKELMDRGFADAEECRQHRFADLDA
jgi:hypothetical protein